MSTYLHGYIQWEYTVSIYQYSNASFDSFFISPVSESLDQNINLFKWHAFWISAYKLFRQFMFLDLLHK